MKTLSTEDIISILMSNLLFYEREICEQLAIVIASFDKDDLIDLMQAIKEIIKQDNTGLK